ncbi:MAG TPA: carboxypeptidase regulatory-like domain-containing protein [Terracidiphilus sp.]|jgi:hypothetical protein
MQILRPAALFVFASLPAATLAQQQQCVNGVRIEGTARDPSGAAIAGAQVQAANGTQTTTDATGRFVLDCVPSAATMLTVKAEGFAQMAARPQDDASGIARIDLRLAIASLQTDVQVRADATDLETSGGAGSTDLGTADVQRLPEDPDDLLRQLQLLAVAGGGDPSAAIITVDGFQNTSALPPKSAISAIRVNPDLFSSEYQWPPFGGGVIEIITKPGADALHGAVFFTDSNPLFNATDPFSATATPAGKQRYGFELGGPLIRRKSGFTLALEKRDIDEFNVVDATTLNANDSPAPFLATVAAPQRLWIASARGDWQISPTDSTTISYSANVNNLDNQGIGGLVLPEAGYSSLTSEYDLRLSNTLTLNPNTLHETRVGYSWKRTQESPLSIAPSLQVAGFFTGGGATSQNLDDRERDLEADDDMMLTRGRHTLKFGVESSGYFIRDSDPDTFNGAYVFGGSSAPVLDAGNNPAGQTTSITGLERYRRALLGLAGGTATTYQVTTGTPIIPITEWHLGFFANDTWKLMSNFSIGYGLRYQFETTPGSFDNFAPRAGIAWALDKKQTWMIHLRGGLFPRAADEFSEIAQVYRLNGVRQHSIEVYSPSYNNALTSAAGSIPINTVNQFPRSFSQMNTFLAYLNIEHEFPRHWHARLNLLSGADWNTLLIRNINAPTVASSAGTAPDPTAALLAPRPIAANENIFQYQNSGHLSGNVVSFSLEQHNYKRGGLSFYYKHMNFKANTVDSGIDSPQSSYSQKGEAGHVEWSRDSYFTFSGNLVLPLKVELDTQFDGGDGGHYDVTTGTDNNGDGDFNDRPSYATGPGPGIYATRFGLLTNNTVNGDLPRDIGIMPGPLHLDANLSRAFTLNPSDKESPRTVTFNARSANLLNHTDVTAVNSVLASSNVGQSIAAETARRIELGVRFAF